MIQKATERHVTRLIAWALPIILAAFVFYATASAVYGEAGTAYQVIRDAPQAPSVSTGTGTPTPAATTAATGQPDFLLMYLALILCMLGIIALTVVHAVASR